MTPRPLARKVAVLVAATFACALIAPAAASAAITFAPPDELATGDGPLAVAVGDFNNDGNQDLTTADFDLTGGVSVLLGTGSGTFNPATSFPAGNGPNHVAVGEFNHDGNQDLAVTNLGSANVSVLLGTGSGSFGAPTNYAAGDNPTGVSVGDFNNDGNQDLASVSEVSGEAGFFPGDGTGAFGTPTVVGGLSTPNGTAVGDFNNDGKPDLAVAQLVGTDLAVMLNTTTGGTIAFAGPQQFAVGSNQASVAVSDFNGDGRPDLATADIGTIDASYLLNTTVGATLSFGAFQSLVTGNDTNGVTVADFDGDGIQDLAFASNLSDVAVFAGDGAGGFAPAVHFAGGGDPTAIANGDFNNDGARDLVAANPGANTVDVLLNAPTADATPGALGFPTTASGTVSPPQEVLIANNGSAPLSLAGFVFGGPNPSDFLTGGDTCHGPVPAGGTCAVSVRFSPQAPGARSATLTALTNAPADPVILLTGTGGPIPQGPPGASVTCRVVKKKIKKKKKGRRGTKIKFVCTPA